MNAPFALFTLDYPPEHGGVARYLGDLVTAADGELDVFVPETHAVDGPGAVRTIRAFRTGRWAWRPLVASLLSLRRSGYRALLVSHALPAGTAALLARWLGGVPYAVLVHGLDLRLAAGHWRRRWLFRLVLRQACAVFTNSALVAGEVKALEPRVEPVVASPGIRPRTYASRSEARRLLGIPDEAFLCVTVARLVPRKGIDRFLEVLPGLPPDVRYVVVGNGDDRARLQGLADRSGSANVRFVVDADDVERDRWIAAADLFVFLARETAVDVEGFGIVCLEAAQAGLPVLAGRSGGVPEAVVDGETGLLVDPNDPGTIRSAFLRLYADPGLRARLGAAGAARVVRSFAWGDRWRLIRDRLSV